MEFFLVTLAILAAFFILMLAVWGIAWVGSRL